MYKGSHKLESTNYTSYKDSFFTSQFAENNIKMKIFDESARPSAATSFLSKRQSTKQGM